ncbi:hypothetical protein N7468_006763 [Penicillium chermesinum]|uniref:Uncharacterized protein n=1 Tax=Penicillium chermesinum TaxID=63820 RepID=A0A9W9NT71_9EURO|nr:uncharacterized protein N7468_006763 [Penicillium chermesinum]KAJ5225538.1 hypothetical protein N7468_006763 [Penicillium chermesinum]
MPQASEAQAPGPTRQLCSWIGNLSIGDIPEEVRIRAKYLILDGICCALVGAHLSWTKKAANTVFAIEPPGDCVVWGYEKKLGALSAALLNSTEIQAFEIDDWHAVAPLHSNSILLPALFAAANQQKAKTQKLLDGKALLLATIVGYETGPRVGLCLHGAHMLARGWHSGTVFGPAASASAVAKLSGLQEDNIKDALGIAYTQACGLMTAQFGSDLKRMQHGFSARNGLFAALMAQGHYTGVRNVFEQRLRGTEPPFLPEGLTKGLGSIWQSDGIRVKSYASMAGTYCTIDAIAELQKENSERLSDFDNVTSIQIELSEAAFKHGGWKPTLQLANKKASPKEFCHDLLNRDSLWSLIEKTECLHTPELGGRYEQVTISFADNSVVTKALAAPRDAVPGLSNEEILEKLRSFTKGVMDDGRRDAIVDRVVNLATVADITSLEDLLVGRTVNPIE